MYMPGAEHVTQQPVEYALVIVAGQPGTGWLYEDGRDTPDYATSFATTRFDHEVKGKTETYIINPRQGDVKGIPASHAWELRIVNAKSPKEVTLDGRTLPAAGWSFSADKSTLTVKVPEAPASQKRTVTVKF